MTVNRFSKLFGRHAHGDVAVGKHTDPAHRSIDHFVAHLFALGTYGDPDRRRFLHRLGHDVVAFERVILAAMHDFVVAPDLPQELDALFHAPDPLFALDAECSQLAFMRAADADAEQRSALGDLIERSPLNGEQDGVPNGERRHADRAKAHFAGVSRHGREHSDRFEARLVDQAVAEPNRFEHAGLLGHFGGFDELIDVGETEQRAAIWQADAPFDRQFSHRNLPTAL